MAREHHGRADPGISRRQLLHCRQVHMVSGCPDRPGLQVRLEHFPHPSRPLWDPGRRAVSLHPAAPTRQHRRISALHRAAPWPELADRGGRLSTLLALMGHPLRHSKDQPGGSTAGDRLCAPLGARSESAEAERTRQESSQALHEPRENGAPASPAAGGLFVRHRSRRVEGAWSVMTLPAVTADTLAALTFWTSAALIAYGYVGYPALMYVVGRLRGRVNLRTDTPPRVSLLVPAYNEGRAIQAKILNCAALDYPKERLEILVASDGSTDTTAESIEAATKAGTIRGVVFGRRRGKAAVLNDLVDMATGEVLAISD